MLEAKLLLQKLNHYFPPKDGQRHSITMNDNGDVVVSIRTKIFEFDGSANFTFDGDDELNQGADFMVSAMVKAFNDYIKKEES